MRSHSCFWEKCACTQYILAIWGAVRFLWWKRSLRKGGVYTNDSWKFVSLGFPSWKCFLKFYAVHILGRGLCDISVRECHTHWVAPRLMDWLTACRAQPGNWVVVQLNYHNEFERDQNLSKVLLRSYARAPQYLSLEEWYTISIRLDPSHPNISMHILHNIF